MVNCRDIHLALCQTLVGGGHAVLQLLDLLHQFRVLGHNGSLHLPGMLQFVACISLGGFCFSSGHLKCRDLGVSVAQLLAVGLLECRFRARISPSRTISIVGCIENFDLGILGKKVGELLPGEAGHRAPQILDEVVLVLLLGGEASLLLADLYKQKSMSELGNHGHALFGILKPDLFKMNRLAAELGLQVSEESSERL